MRSYADHLEPDDEGSRRSLVPGGMRDVTAEVAEQVAADLKLFSEIAAADPTTLTDGEVADAALAMARLSGRVDAAFTTLVGAMDRRLLHTADGARSVPAWMAARTELPAKQVNAVAGRARCLRTCPHVDSAYRDGRLGTAKVRLLLAAREQVESIFAAEEEALVEEIAPLTQGRAQAVLARWRAAALATLGLDDDKAPNDVGENSVHLSSTFGGRWMLSGDVAAIGGSTLQGHLDAEIDRLFRTGEFTGDDGLARSQRNCRALLNLVERGAVASTKHGEARPSVTLLIDLRSLLGIPVEDVADLLQRRCHLADGTAVSRADAIELLARAHLSAVLGEFSTDGRFQPVTEVRLVRQANARQRRALALRDEGCVFPGCTSPPAFTHAHHVDTWHDTHQTAVPRLALVCSFHHHAIHDRGFHVDIGFDGKTVTARRPDGTALPQAPPGHKIEPDAAATARAPSRFRSLHEQQSWAEHEQAWFRTMARDRLDASKDERAA